MVADTNDAGGQPDEAKIEDWFDAFNRRDLDGMVACADLAIEFRPLRFPGVESVYRGHDGIREWFAVITAAGEVHRIEPEELETLSDGRILVSGSVSLAAAGAVAPFSGIYSVANGLIREASHYFTPSTILDRLGVIEAGSGQTARGPGLR